MLGRLLTLLGLTALVVTQPVLDLLGRSPATFEIHGVEGRSILLFAVAVAVVPPAALWLLGEAVTLVDERAGRIAHLVLVGGLLAIFGVLLAKAISSATALHLLVGLAVGAAGVWLHDKHEPVRTWMRLLAVANIAFVAQFGFFSPVTDWIDSATGSPEVLVAEPIESADDDAGTPRREDPPSVFMLVLDEFATGTLLDGAGEIDPVRFPNLATFADDATFHRRYTTSSPFTHTAVPSMLTGREPSGGPTWTDHPENLFNVFASSHHLIVSEFLTRLCGFDSCGSAPIPPPPPAAPAENENTANTPNTTAPPPGPTSSGARWGDLLRATLDVWQERVSPGNDDGPDTFDDFVEQIDAIESPAPTTTIEPPRADPVTTLPGADGRTEEEIALERFFDLQVGAQPSRLAEFLDAVRPSDDPLFGYLHLVLPHQPWVLREDGTTYAVAAGREDFEADHADPWSARVGRQRHVLQTQYTDRIVGEFLSHLDGLGMYDESLIVILGDHGVAFEPGQSSRSLTPENLASIAYVPLLIKAPGQQAGTVEDHNISAIDLAPTVAELLGVRLPWETDGLAAGSPEVADRGSVKSIHDYADAFEYTSRGIIEFDDDEQFAKLVADRFPTLSPEDDPVAGLYAGVRGEELIGLDPDDIFAPGAGATAQIVELDRLREPGDQPMLGELAGRVTGPSPDAIVVVAVNGRVVGVSPQYVRSGESRSFVVLLPGDALGPSGNHVRAAALEPDGSVVELGIDG